MNALTDKRGALYPLTQSQKRTAAAIPTYIAIYNSTYYKYIKYKNLKII